MRTKGAVDRKARKSSRPDQWRALRFCHKCGEPVTVFELAAAAGCSVGAASKFLADLRKAGLVAFAGRAARGAKAWALAKDLGPACPVVSRGVARDMNAVGRGGKDKGKGTAA